MLYSPTFFISAVSGLIRIGKGFREVIRKRETTQTFHILMDQFPDRDPDKLQQGILRWLFVAAKENPSGAIMQLLQPGGELDLIFTPDCLVGNDAQYRTQRKQLSGDGEIDTQMAYAASLYFDYVRKRHADGWGEEFTRLRDQSPLVAYVHSKWVTDNEPSAWGRFGMELADVTLEVVGAQPNVLGLGQKASNVLESLAPNLERLIERRQMDGGQADPLGEELVKTFVFSALDSVVKHPDLVTTEERWEPVIEGMVMPLKEEMLGQDGQLQFIAKDRMQRALRGPVIYGALKAIDANASAFLKGDASQDKVLGEVSRTILSGLVERPPPGGLNLKRVFSEHGVLRIYDAAMQTASSRPDLFVRGNSDEAQAGRDLLQRMALSMDGLGLPPFDKDSGLRAELVSTMFEVAGEYGNRRFADNSDGGHWDNTWADVYSSLLGNILSGLEHGIQQRISPNGAGGLMALDDDPKGLFARVFSREQAVGVVKIIATHVASTPHMVTGEDANIEAMNIAQVAAAAIASDTSGLLMADDWRRVISAMLGAAASNPGVLFSIDEGDGYHNQLSLVLIQHVMMKASESMQSTSRVQGRILFGETLREALVATVQAATANLRASVMTRTETGDRSHVSALGDFIDLISSYAHGDQPQLAMTADDWLHVYKYFLAHILEKGPEGLRDVTPEAVVEALQSDVNLARISTGAN